MNAFNNSIKSLKNYLKNKYIFNFRVGLIIIFYQNLQENYNYIIISEKIFFKKFNYQSKLLSSLMASFLLLLI